MAGSNNAELLRNANLRLCRLRVWQNFEGLGFNLEASSRPPHIIRLVESNSPAAAGGLKILDVILAVNQQDVSNADYNQVRNAIKAARDSNGPIELRVIEQRAYQALKKKNISMDSLKPTVIETPVAMPPDYQNFPKHQPRTCNIRLNQSDTFGFEVVNGENDVGAYIQEVFPNTPASNTPLRKSDRIIEIDDKYVEKDVSKSILEKLSKAKSKGAVKLYVVDTETYKYYQLHKIPLASKGKRKSHSEERSSTNQYAVNERESPSIRDGSQLAPSNPPTLRDTPKARTPSVPDLTRQSRPPITPSLILPSPPQPLPNEDIRLCTINRADGADTFGIELNFHRKEQFHSLTITPGQDNGPSNAELAGIKNDDRLIEINGQNIQTFDHDQVTQRIRAVKYPQPLQMLVANVPTYEYYKQQQKLIHGGLPNVKILPTNRPASSISS